MKRDFFQKNKLVEVRNRDFKKIIISDPVPYFVRPNPNLER